MTAERLKDGKTFGVSALTEALEDIQFPISRSNLLQKKGQVKIQWVQDESETLESLLDNVEQDEFYGVSDIVSAISHPGQA